MYLNKNPFQTELTETSDGSHTLKLVGADEQYHSLNGAMQESEHVFIQAGFNSVIEKAGSVNILEVGLGAGLNALLTLKSSVELQKQVYYDAIEAYPLEKDWLKRLNYTSLLREDWFKEGFKHIHEAPDNTFLNIREVFHIRCFKKKLEDVELAKEKYDLVYFDAFGPDTQPELWTAEIFDKIGKAMRSGAVLVTYSAKGAVRRAMKEAGFEVKKIPGPPGKREMTRAVKI
ncbi:MAG: tRNA (5-methylaminomethyl-2-thiouridine)(34)-methyltransferase MnmD [Bacteroidales bacterium]